MVTAVPAPRPAGPPGQPGQPGQQGQPGQPGEAGPAGADGAPGRDGTDGSDGRDGTDGTQIITRTISGSAWSDAEARAALAARGRSTPQIGDLVTLANGAAGFAETRIWDGTGWVAAGEQLNGNSLIRGTVAADALVLDGVSMRGDSTTGAISVGRLVAPVITLPTEAGGRFQTHAFNREIIADRTINRRERSVLFGPFKTARDAFSQVHGRFGEVVLAPHDSFGDTPDRSVNNHLNRLFFFRPTFRLSTSYAPQSAELWGRFVYDLEMRVQFYHGPRPATYTAFSRHPMTLSARRAALVEGPSNGGSLGLILVYHDYDHTVRRNPADTSLARGMTSRFDARFRVRPLIPRDTGLDGRRLWLKVWMTPLTRGISQSAAFTLLARNLEFSGSTLG